MNDDTLAAFEAIRVQTTAALRALTPSGSEDDVATTRHARAHTTRFLTAFDALLAEESPELSARCVEIRPAPRDEEDLLARAVGLLERADDPSAREDADAMFEDVWARERLDAPPGAPPPLTPDEIDPLRAFSADGEIDPFEFLSDTLDLIARGARGRPEEADRFEDYWKAFRPQLEQSPGAMSEDLRRAVAVNFPTWHDPIDAHIFPLTTERLVEVVCSLDRLDEWHPKRGHWIEVLLLFLTVRHEKLPELVFLVVTLELARAGVRDAVMYAPFLLGGLDVSP